MKLLQKCTAGVLDRHFKTTDCEIVATLENYLWFYTWHPHKSHGGKWLCMLHDVPSVWCCPTMTGNGIYAVRDQIIKTIDHNIKRY